MEVAATVGGVATSTILSAMSASLARSVVSAEARTIRGKALQEELFQEGIVHGRS